MLDKHPAVFIFVHFWLIMPITVIDPMSSDLLTSPLLEHEHARGAMRSRPRLEKWMESMESAHNGVTSQHPLRAHVHGGPGGG